MLMLLSKLNDAIMEKISKRKEEKRLSSNRANTNQDKSDRQRPYNPCKTEYCHVRYLFLVMGIYTAIISCPNKGGKETIIRRTIGTSHDPWYSAMAAA